MARKRKKEIVGVSVETILRQGELVKKIESLNYRKLLSNDFIKVSQSQFGETLYDCSKPLVIVNFVQHYEKLEKWLIQLDQVEPEAARDAARVLVKKLSAVCRYYNPAQRQSPHQQSAGAQIFSDLLQSTSEEIVPPSRLLKECPQEFEQALAPVTQIDNIVKTVVVLACALTSAAALVALCITAAVFLPQFIPALKPIVAAVASPIPHMPTLSISNSFDLFTIGNAVSAGVGALLGTGASFFAMHKIQRSRLSEFHACLKIVKELVSKIDIEQQQGWSYTKCELRR